MINQNIVLSFIDKAEGAGLSYCLAEGSRPFPTVLLLTPANQITVSITINAVPGSPPMVEVSTETVVTGIDTDV